MAELNPRKPIRVLMLIPQLGYGGAERSFIRLANYLHSNANMQVCVALFTMDYGTTAHSTDREPLDAQMVLLDEGRGTSLPERWFRRWRKLRALKAQHDVCISFLSGPNMLNGLAGFATKTIVSIRGSRFFDPKLSPCRRWLYQFIIDPLTYAMAARIVAVSPGLYDELQRQVWPSRLRRAFSVISPFVLSDALDKQAIQPPPEHLTALAGQPVIVAVGRLSVEKGFVPLLEVFHRLLAHKPDAKLLLVGDGELQQPLMARCSELAIPVNVLEPSIGSVIFAGHQRLTVPCITLGQVFVLSSLTEGLPNVVLEAFAANVMVVASDAPWGARAVLCEQTQDDTTPYPTTRPREADYGILMPRIDRSSYHEQWADTLLRCLQDETMRHRYEQAGKKRLLEYDISVVAPRWKKLIEQLAEENTKKDSFFGEFHFAL